MREGMKKDWNLCNSFNSLAAFFCQYFYWLSLPKKQWCFKLFCEVWMYLAELMRQNVSQLLARVTHVYTHLNWKNKRAVIILSHSEVQLFPCLWVLKNNASHIWRGIVKLIVPACQIIYCCIDIFSLLLISIFSDLEYRIRSQIFCFWCLQFCMEKFT